MEEKREEGNLKDVWCMRQTLNISVDLRRLGKKLFDVQ